MQQDIESLFATFHRRVWLYLRAMGCEAALAEDIVQEAFLALDRTIHAGRIVEAPEHYLNRSAKNLYLLHLRKHRREVDLGDVEQMWESWVGERGDEPAMQALRTCLEELDVRARDLLRMRYGERCGRDALAKALGISPDGVSKIQQRTLAKLRECVERRIDQ